MLNFESTMKYLKTTFIYAALLFLISCSKKDLKYKVVYDDGSQTFMDSMVKKEGNSIVFTEGFDGTDVVISNHSKTLYEEEVTSNHITGMASDFIFIPSEGAENKIVLSMEGVETELTEFMKYRYVYVTCKDDIVELEYSNRIWLFD